MQLRRNARGRDRDARGKEARALEGMLGVTIPARYRTFLIEKGAAVVNGLPLLGLPLAPDVDCAWGATELLRALRPDLSDHLVVVRILDTRALCLDLRSEPHEDAPLVEVDLDGSQPARKVHDSFRVYLEEGERSEQRIAGALRRIKWHLENSRKLYDHRSGKRPPFRAHEWRVIRSCVHDRIVGLTAIRHNEAFNGLEVDVFVCTDHPDYEPAHGARALMTLILSDAYRNAGSMEIRFTRYDSSIGCRVPERVPDPVVALGKIYGISFTDEKAGSISHHESVQLYASIIGLDDNVKKVVRSLESSQRMSLQGLCYLLGTRLWSREEASWVLLNHPRPEGLLFGEDVPEARLRYLESLAYGRAAVAVTRLREKLEATDRERDGDCIVEVRGPVWELCPTGQVILDWRVSGEAVSLAPGHRVAVLPRPRTILPGEETRMLEEARQIAKYRNGHTHSYLLYSKEMLDLPNLAEIAAKTREASAVDILILPAGCRELDETLEIRLSRARALRA